MNTKTCRMVTDSTTGSLERCLSDCTIGIRNWFSGLSAMFRAAIHLLREQKGDWERAASLASRGARLQFEIAVALVSIIPLLGVVWLSHDRPLTVDLTNGIHVAVVGMSILMIVLGYALLTKYPRTIVRLRHSLEKLAAGKIPDELDFEEPQEDIKVLEQCMNFVLKQTRERIRTIEEQNRKIAEAEKLKVMAQSLAAACHHLGQPAMTLTLGIEMLRMHHRVEDPVLAETLHHCWQASCELNEVLQKLQSLREYRTEPYLSGVEGCEENFTDRILVVK